MKSTPALSSTWADLVSCARGLSPACIMAFTREGTWGLLSMMMRRCSWSTEAGVRCTILANRSTVAIGPIPPRIPTVFDMDKLLEAHYRASQPKIKLAWLRSRAQTKNRDMTRRGMPGERPASEVDSHRKSAAWRPCQGGVRADFYCTAWGHRTGLPLHPWLGIVDGYSQVRPDRILGSNCPSRTGSRTESVSNVEIAQR